MSNKLTEEVKISTLSRFWKQLCSRKSPFCSSTFSSCSFSLSTVVIVDFHCFHDNGFPLWHSSHLSLSLSLSFHQSKQEVEGLDCDVVRVEVEESLTKEQLLEIFITCGRNTHTQRTIQKKFSHFDEESSKWCKSMPLGASGGQHDAGCRCLCPTKVTVRQHCSNQVAELQHLPPAPTTWSRSGLSSQSCCEHRLMW